MGGEDGAEGIAGGGEVGGEHFDVFAGEDDAVGSGGEGGFERVLHVVGVGLLVASLRAGAEDGNVDVDAGIDFGLSGDAGEGALRLLGDVVGREAVRGELVEGRFVVVHDLVVQREKVLRLSVVEDRAAERFEVGVPCAGRRRCCRWRA